MQALEQKAQEALREGLKNKAAVLRHEAWTNNPGNIEAAVNAGYSWSEVGQYGKAITVLTDARKRNPGEDGNRLDGWIKEFSGKAGEEYESGVKEALTIKNPAQQVQKLEQMAAIFASRTNALIPLLYRYAELHDALNATKVLKTLAKADPEACVAALQNDSMVTLGADNTFTSTVDDTFGEKVSKPFLTRYSEQLRNLKLWEGTWHLTLRPRFETRKVYPKCSLKILANADLTISIVGEFHLEEKYDGDTTKYDLRIDSVAPNDGLTPRDRYEYALKLDQRNYRDYYVSPPEVSAKESIKRHWPFVLSGTISEVRRTRKEVKFSVEDSTMVASLSDGELYILSTKRDNGDAISLTFSKTAN
jgi:hypothetical protein